MGHPQNASGRGYAHGPGPDPGLARSLGTCDRRAPRTVRRFGLSEGACRPRDLQGRTAGGRGRRVRRDHSYAFVQEADDGAGRTDRVDSLLGYPVRPRDGPRIPRHFDRKASPRDGSDVVVPAACDTRSFPPGNDDRRRSGRCGDCDRRHRSRNYPEPDRTRRRAIAC